MQLVSIIHVIVCVFLIIIILFQSGKGGGVSGAFGGGLQNVASGNSAATVLGKITSYFAAAFMITSLTLAVMSSPKGPDLSDLEEAPSLPCLLYTSPSPRD